MGLEDTVESDHRAFQSGGRVPATAQAVFHGR